MKACESKTSWFLWNESATIKWINFTNNDHVAMNIYNRVFVLIRYFHLYYWELRVLILLSLCYLHWGTKGLWGLFRSGYWSTQWLGFLQFRHDSFVEKTGHTIGIINFLQIGRLEGQLRTGTDRVPWIWFTRIVTCFLAMFASRLDWVVAKNVAHSIVPISAHSLLGSVAAHTHCLSQWSSARL